MTQPPILTDRKALVRHRDRARALPGHDEALFLHRLALADLEERLDEVNKRFTAKAVITAFPQVFRAWTDAKVVADEDLIELDPIAHDLVVHFMCLHWANDPVGQLVQCRRALRPDGLCLVVLPGGRSLQELRAALAEAETSVTGGLSPRVVPMGEIRDLGALMQRAGFALPVADSLLQMVEYRSFPALLADLRGAGESNALDARLKHFTRRAVLTEAARIYASNYGTGDGRLAATAELVVLTGWAPHESQQQPLRPGSAKARLADALGVPEKPLKDG